MPRLAALFLVGVVATPATAQQNPFKLPKSTLKAEVNYEMGGDSKGTALTAFDGERYASRTTSTTKMMGKETNVSEWSMITADSMYHADLIKKRGIQSPNLLPFLAKAYDGLGGDGKRRFHQKSQEMATMDSRGLDIASLSLSSDRVGEKTIAGEVCEERKFGTFTVCNMKKAPRIPLETSGRLLCFNFSQTATSVKLGTPSADAFQPPAGITFTVNPAMQNPDSMARGFVGYLASQQLADSLAKAKQQLEEAKAKASTEGKPTEMTPEQKAQAQAACEMIKNTDLNKVMADAANAMLRAMKDAAVEGAKQGAANKLKGMFKKRIP